ncbi:glycerol-3-phosphate phosphatase [Diaphorina citri]|jgi:phosphoglycolate/pyridoxal phosphate phosphatase family|uniref:Glycerol-3-phosphate phosphatase n=1 Tax=Diaphorina citri TaxID=121845 RepID=A0A1S3CVN3_DIACI|nr:glycerol-3-phosphate phosphatase [Diaphorina citri]KAI5709428.1 hypothetical protein M8J75_000149 [Diaphorina citri]KAI5744210.1 hypothetical protein M8J76_000136 [Diaphorina citri]KAI5752770.1 hypothetical protein M8J77_020155 [Diaphorina citri]
MKLINLSELSGDKQKDFLNSFDTVLTDCDGVLWLENELISGADQVMNSLKSLGKKIFYVTNNSTKTREQLIVKLKHLGFNAEPNEIIGTAYLAAQYLKKHLDPKKKAYIVGSSGIADELNLAGIENFGVGPDVMIPGRDLKTDHEKLNLDPHVGAVVVGFDSHISFPKLMKAACYLTNPNTLFVATNTDESFPMGPHVTVPGTGSMVAAVKTGAQREPVVIGKPSKLIGSYLIEKYNLNPERTLMIGDRGNTDIRLGYNNGFQTLLVLTGDTTMEKAIAWSKSEDEEYKSRVADYYLSSLGDMLPFLSS